MTKSRIFKNLNLRKKADRNFRGFLLKNRFRYQNFIHIPQADWPGVVVIWTPFERQKIEVHIFERANLSGFLYVEVQRQRRLKSTKAGISS